MPNKMVIQRQQNIASRLFPNSTEQCFFKQEIDCFQKSLLLTPINMIELNPSIIATFLYPVTITSLVFLFSYLISIMKNARMLDMYGVVIVYFAFLVYGYCGGIAYRMFLNKEPDTKFLSYVYVCMYSMTYYPVALFVALLLGPVGSIIMFALVLLTQYILTTTLCFGYEFPTNTRRFVFSLLTLIIQFIFVIGLQSLIANQMSQIKI